MGTILQEIGHDAVIVAFIDSVLAPRKDSFFYVVTPAIGPKRDIYFFDRQSKRFISAWSHSKENYIPEFYYRMTFSQKDMARLASSTTYAKESWYAALSEGLKRDAVAYLSPLLKSIEEELHSDLPDIISFDKDGKLNLIAEIKFEGFSAKAKESTIKEYEYAKKVGVPYMLVIPKRPSYGSEVTNTWVKANLPSDMVVYKFEADMGAVVPKQSEITFAKV